MGGQESRMNGSQGVNKEKDGQIDRWTDSDEWMDRHMDAYVENR